MKLAELGVFAATSAQVVFMGQPEVSGILTSEGEPYYVWKLKTPITVRCSTNPEIMPMEEVDELYIRERDLDADGWRLVGEKPEDGITIDGWKADFSTGQKIPIFSSTTIRQWAQEQRKGKKEERISGINATIVERMKNRGTKS